MIRLRRCHGIGSDGFVSLLGLVISRDVYAQGNFDVHEDVIYKLHISSFIYMPHCSVHPFNHHTHNRCHAIVVSSFHMYM